MNLQATLKKLETQFPEYLVKLKNVPEEDGLISFNVFGVSRADFHDVKESIFDLEETFSGEEIFIPICYTKQEIFDHYPAIAEEYVLKQKALVKKKEAEVMVAVLSDIFSANCFCAQKTSTNLLDTDGFSSGFNNTGGYKGLRVPVQPDSNYAMAA